MMIRRISIIPSIFILCLFSGTLLYAEQTVQDFINELKPGNFKPRTETTEGKAGIGTARGFAQDRTSLDKPMVTLHLPFELNSSELKADAFSTLKNLGLALESEALKGFVYRLEGHTCDLGTDAYNMSLSRKRAMAVRNYLAQSFNLDDHQLRVVWFGERRPAFRNKDEASRRKNRRVIIINTLESFDLPIDNKAPVILQIKGLRDGMERIVHDGDSLDANDRYAVEFKTRDMAFIYIFQIDSAGNVQKLFPKSDLSQHGNPTDPQSVYRIPSPVRWLQLDENKGVEKIILLASHEPVDNPQEICMDAVGESYQASNTRGVGGVRRDKPAPDSSSHGAETLSDDNGNHFVMMRHFLHR